MTEVYLHGILGKKYGKKHKLCLSKPKDLLFAMEANYEGFIKDLKDLARKNIHYTFVVNNEWCKNNEVSVRKKINKLNFTPIIFGHGPAMIFFAIFSLVVSIGSAYYAYIQAGKVEYPKIPGASGSATNAFSKSIAFSNRENLAEHGNPVPLVYGRFKVGSFVIQSTVKSFPLIIDFSDELKNSSSLKGNNQTASIFNSDFNPFKNVNIGAISKITKS